MKSINWTIESIPDLTGKTVLVTGGNSGLGFEAVKVFAQKGAFVVMACRSLAKGEEAKKQITGLNPTAIISVMELDLTDLKSIHSFVNQFKEYHSRLDILLNNAGIMMVPYGLTKDGFENQIGTNHLGHFALTGQLLELLKTTPNSRVVNVSSMAHKSGVMDMDDLLYENGKNYSPIKAYGRSKLSNLLFTYELQRFFEKNKIDTIAVAAHPGVSDTNLFNHAAPKWLMNLLRPLFLFIIQPASMGALPEIRAAVDADVKGGQYYGPDGKREMKGYPVLVESTEASHNENDARKLWELSEKLTGVKFK
ncbi:MAG: oxidoreductase [Paludibacter sp.]|jgi:NAD(P)-dependent dehydrogenase (short-subunit alcohol dehydrogenase family)